MDRGANEYAPGFTLWRIRQQKCRIEKLGVKKNISIEVRLRGCTKLMNNQKPLHGAE